MKFNYILFISIFIFLGGCNQKQKAAENLQIVFGEKEEATDHYQTRIIVTPDYMRFDDGEGAQDFVLFDRKKKIVYSVTAESKQIMIIEDTDIKIPAQPALKLNKDIINDTDDYPTMIGKKPVHYKFKSGEEACFETISVDGLLPAYVAALKEFNGVLAKDSMSTLISMPADMRDNCDLAIDTFAPNRHLDLGFPIRYWDKKGFVSTLLEYEEGYKADKLLFEIPADYFKLSVTEMRQRASSSNAVF